MHKFFFIFNILARKDVFCFLLLWIIVILIMGTLEQQTIGLYLAQKKYFSSFILWGWGYIPLPGGFLTMICVFFGLLTKLLCDKWIVNKLGIIIVHFGGLVLLFGGFITMLFSYEGHMIVYEGEKSNYIIDNNNIEFVVTDVANEKICVIFCESDLMKRGSLISDNLPFSIKVNKICKNCNFIQRKVPLDKKNSNVLSRFLFLESRSFFKNNENNCAGLSFYVSSESDKSYSICEFMFPQYILYMQKIYKIELRRARFFIPFFIQLVKFEKEMYPGTNISKMYKSNLFIHDNGIKWHECVEMNKPLRYKGFVFYQSSFISEKNQVATVFSVVKNIGDFFPYMAGIMVSVGLFFHLIQVLLRLNRKSV